MTEATPSDPASPPSSGRPTRPGFGEAARVWGRVAALSFGGPAGQIAVMQRILVDERRWVSQRRFLHALNYCMLLPGPEAQQLATYVGWLLHGTRGGLVAGSLFVLPGFVAILGLSLLYALYGDAGLVAALFYGLKPAVIAVVVEALVRIGRRALDVPAKLAIAAAAFASLFFLDLPFPAVVVAAAAAGLLLGKMGVAGFASGPRPSDAASEAAIHDAPEGVAQRPSWRRSARVAAVWLTIWWAPVAAFWLAAGRASVLVREGVFFGKVAVVTFGGAYAALAYVAQRAVEGFGWLRPGEMLDGLAMAETTPGPLIQVLQFVGFMAAFRDPGGLPPLAAGVLGSLVTTWAIFAPCFLWIFLGAPYIEWLRGRRTLDHALSAITAAVVGVILNLAVWFALHTLFAEVRTVPFAIGRLLAPAWPTIDVPAALIAGAALFALLRLKLGMLPTFGLAAAAGLAVHWLG